MSQFPRRINITFCQVVRLPCWVCYLQLVKETYIPLFVTYSQFWAHRGNPAGGIGSLLEPETIMSLKEVVATTEGEFDWEAFVAEIKAVEHLTKEIEHLEQLSDDEFEVPEFDWEAFVAEIKAVEHLTLAELEELVPDEEPTCLAIVLYQDNYISDPNDMGPFDRKWLRL